MAVSDNDSMTTNQCEGEETLWASPNPNLPHPSHQGTLTTSRLASCISTSYIQVFGHTSHPHSWEPKEGCERLHKKLGSISCLSCTFIAIVIPPTVQSSPSPISISIQQACATLPDSQSSHPLAILVSTCSSHARSPGASSNLASTDCSFYHNKCAKSSSSRGPPRRTPNTS